MLGEAEILGQVRAALDACTGAGPFLRGVVRRGAQGRRPGPRRDRARRRRAVGGLGGRAVARGAELPLGRSRVLVVGAGATGVKAARHLRGARRRRASCVANRTRERADGGRRRALAAEATGLDALPDAAGRGRRGRLRGRRSPTHVITLDDLRQAAAARDGRPLLMVDLSMPPAVEPGDVAGVTRIDLATLEQQVAARSAIAARPRFPRPKR